MAWHAKGDNEATNGNRDKTVKATTYGVHVFIVVSGRELSKTLKYRIAYRLARLRSKTQFLGYLS